MEIYVIASSWNDVLYKLDAWSKSYYVASVYYNQLSKKKDNVIFNVYESDGTFQYMQLLNNLKRDFDTDIDKFIESELTLVASKDGNLCAIFKKMFLDSFNAGKMDIDPYVYSDMTDIISRVCLSSVPLVRYINNGDWLFTLLFEVYRKASVDKNSELDMVYFWYLFLKVDCVNIISNFYNGIIPEDTVFIRVDEY